MPNAILTKMLDRLFASMASGPSLNCRPHSSRQRVDLSHLSRLQDIAPSQVLIDLLSEKQSATVSANVPPPPDLPSPWSRRKDDPPADVESDAAEASAIEVVSDVPPISEAVDAHETCDAAATGVATPTTDVAGESIAPEATPESSAIDEPSQPAATEAQSPDEPVEPKEDAAHRDWRAQKSLINKLRILSDDARTYEQDTGVHVLNIGYPLLALPPGTMGGTRRVIAPIAFIPVTLKVKTGARPGVEIACREEGEDRVVPNEALVTWVERQMGKPAGSELFSDEEGVDPWREVRELIEHIAGMLGLDKAQAAAMTSPESLALVDAPKADELDKPTIIPAAVLGLFPASNQGLVRDTQSMIAEPALLGPVTPFVDMHATLSLAGEPAQAAQSTASAGGDVSGDAAPPVDASPRVFTEERLVTRADPCQSRAVRHARESAGLVIHGPPGTGKSQTITNIIGDHLARGQRVLFVCDKRTALDVVANRLEHMGMGDLCALVHDPQRDQRDLYKAVRTQLDELADATLPRNPLPKLERIDEELQRLHSELTEVYRSLMTSDGDAQSFHELVGQWLTIETDAPANVGDDASIALLDCHHQAIDVTLQRGRKIEYPTNRWVRCAGLTLDAFLARPIDEMRRALASCAEDGRSLDATAHESIPPFNATEPLDEQAKRRATLLQQLDWIRGHVADTVTQRCVAWPGEVARRRRQDLSDVEPYLAILRDGSLDAELQLTVRGATPSPATLAPQLGELDAYIEVSSKWYGFLAFGAKSRAAKVLRSYGLSATPDQAKRLRKFLVGLRARLVLSDAYGKLVGNAQPGSVIEDAELETTLAHHKRILETLALVDGVAELDAPSRGALTDREAYVTFADGLRRSEARAASLAQFESTMRDANLFDSRWLSAACEQLRTGRRATENLVLLQSQFDTLEDALRIRAAIDELPQSLRTAVGEQLKEGIDSEEGLRALTRGVLGVEIKHRLASHTDLQRLDADRLQNSFERYRQLDLEKHDVVRAAIRYHWMTLQRERLLASTGSRLNSLGARTRQRLFIRGRRAMRLRQMIAAGRDGQPEGEAASSATVAADGGNTATAGDPLFDLRPVWMCSPETVAQVFPREPVFDVVVFDEASQCRLEEALPVLTRARRVVVAGDPKQLPPTRFFEAAVTISDDKALETEQDLFEAQQGEVEDLLAAALNLEIQESYLDVHYRSRNADLIAFSNEQFYGSRLQAIPGHPANRTPCAPLTLHRASGVYDKRVNEIEAQHVVQIVHDLLRRAEPPSIGIACFNLSQRDLIVELLEDRAAEDSDFASRLAAARQRQGEGSFEGLFVKNLENVQGDERDHIIISTTYGPAPNGKFYRRFGPLGQAGGGRRLNVLVTRARHEVHLVTSIPREAYLALPPIPAGQAPGGGWLLLSYLRFAEELGALYEQNSRILAEAQQAATTRVNVRMTHTPSDFAVGVGRAMAREQSASSDIHWGNDGFLVDVALHHPTRVEDVTIGILCDATRYRRAQDPVEWDVFRTGILESQGWTLHRLWSPHFVRDPEGCLSRIRREVDAILTRDANAAP